tara:strand:- start:484 stop:720 length:237 start_codon:yes stop_codon:yes gene_type:complete
VIEMSWEDIIKDDSKYDLFAERHFGGQKDVRVEYINKELRKDVDKLIEILKETPSNIFHDVKQDFQELLEKYSEYLRD